jgi:ABC-type branched-subunit amino acid transport system ATPase component
VLHVRDLTVTYGGVRAVSEMNLDVAEATVHGLIGPNGAGKSTAINAMTGVIKPQVGSVQIDGQELIGQPPGAILRAGIARTFQQARLWPGMTVMQNLVVPLLSEGRRVAETRANEVATRLGFTDLLEVNAGILPFGARRLVEVGRAMMTKPRIVLLDEPGAGLTFSEKTKLIDVLADLASAGTAVLLVDHDMELVMQASERVTVLDAGTVIAEGTPDEVRSDEAVLAVYLGTE